MAFFSFLFILFVFMAIVKNVNKKLNNPEDTSFDSMDRADGDVKDNEDTDGFPPIEPSEPYQRRYEEAKNPDPVFEEEPFENESSFQEPAAQETVEQEPVEQPVKTKSAPAAPNVGHLFGLIGKPLAHSTAMVRFNKFFREQHIDAYYQNFELDDIEQVRDLVDNNPNLCGFNVTIPFKQDIIPYLTRLDETAQVIGAVNTVKVVHKESGTELIGYNTDWIGFTVSFKELLEGHSKALILGTGGVSKAVKYALDKLGIENRFVSRNSTFDIMGYYELSPSVIDEYDIIVNCTPMGMWPQTNQCPDIPYTFLSERHVLLDVIANPDETLFMKKGREHGATAKGGKDMLEQQAVAAWDIWNSIEI